MKSRGEGVPGREKEPWVRREDRCGGECRRGTNEVKAHKDLTLEDFALRAVASTDSGFPSWHVEAGTGMLKKH